MEIAADAIEEKVGKQATNCLGAWTSYACGRVALGLLLSFELDSETVGGLLHSEQNLRGAGFCSVCASSMTGKHKIDGARGRLRW